MSSVNQEPNSTLIIVSYPVRVAQQTITAAEYSLILGLRQDKVMAIKFVRSQYNLGLYEAKQVVDTIHSQPVI